MPNIHHVLQAKGLGQERCVIMDGSIQGFEAIPKVQVVYLQYLVEGSLEVKLPTIWRDEKQSRAEAERRGRLEERRSEEKE